MFDNIKRFFQIRKLRKYASDLPTGLLPMSQIRTVNAVVDVEEPGFDLLKEDILSWGRYLAVILYHIVYLKSQ